MNKELMIEALEALVEKKERENDELVKQNEYYFELWTTFLEAIHKNGGKKAIEDATKGLGDETKARLSRYVEETFPDA